MSTKSIEAENTKICIFSVLKNPLPYFNDFRNEKYDLLPYRLYVIADEILPNPLEAFSNDQSP